MITKDDILKQMAKDAEKPFDQQMSLLKKIQGEEEVDNWLDTYLDDDERRNPEPEPRGIVKSKKLRKRSYEDERNA